MQTLKAGALYFLLVFSAGFVLGPVRVLWAVPRFGERSAELMEAPIMLTVVVLVARWIVRRYRGLPAARFLGAGVFALALLLSAELTVVLWLRGLRVTDYISSRDPVAGSVYLVLLVAFAAMPAVMARR